MEGTLPYASEGDHEVQPVPRGREPQGEIAERCGPLGAIMEAAYHCQVHGQLLGLVYTVWKECFSVLFAGMGSM